MADLHGLYVTANVNERLRDSSRSTGHFHGGRLPRLYLYRAGVGAALIVATIPLLFFLTKGRMDAIRARESAAVNNSPPR